MKYRKKPVVIEAIQLKRDNIVAVLRFMGQEVKREYWQDFDRFTDYEKYVIDKGLEINTLEGELRAPIGWWIIKGVKGEFYPCDPEIFEETYEKVEGEIE